MDLIIVGDAEIRRVEEQRIQSPLQCSSRIQDSSTPSERIFEAVC
jgi:hypothetical protein